MSQSLTFAQLVSVIQDTDAVLRQRARAAVNVSLTLRNWIFGRWIDEDELAGADRSEHYGQALLASLAARLKERGIRGVSQRQLYRYLTFYRTYLDILPTLTAKSSGSAASWSTREILPTLSAKSLPENLGLLGRLSFSHFEHLLNLDSQEKRRFYEDHCVEAGWSVRELHRQITSLYYERTAFLQG